MTCGSPARKNSPVRTAKFAAKNREFNRADQGNFRRRTGNATGMRLAGAAPFAAPAGTRVFRHAACRGKSATRSALRNRHGAAAPALLHTQNSRPPPKVDAEDGWSQTSGGGVSEPGLVGARLGGRRRRERRCGEVRGPHQRRGRPAGGDPWRAIISTPAPTAPKLSDYDRREFAHTGAQDGGAAEASCIVSRWRGGRRHGPMAWGPMSWGPMAWSPMAWGPMAWGPMAWGRWRGAGVGGRCRRPVLESQPRSRQPNGVNNCWRPAANSGGRPSLGSAANAQILFNLRTRQSA
jgi:hypothetical protein